MADRLSPFSRDIEVMISEELTPEVQGERFAEFARATLAEDKETNRIALGYVPDHDTFVSGAQRPDLTGVKISDTITFEYHLLLDVLQWIDEQLIIHSPVKSGRYAKSHAWFADDVEIDGVEDPPPAQGYVVLNAQPYARKIERGQSSQAPDGVYQGVAAMAKRRFGNIAYVGFTYRSFPGGAVGKWAQTASARHLARNVRGGNPRTREDWLTRQPAILVDPGR